MATNDTSASAQDLQRRLDDELAANAERTAALRRERDQLVEAAVSANVDDEHDPEGATLAFEREQISALIAQAEHARDEIVAAQERVASGGYGVCETCARPIASGRLEARPTARTCVDCAR